MRYSWFGLLILSCLVVWSGKSVAQDTQEEWVEVTTNVVGDRFLVDRRSIEVEDDAVVYWEYRDFQQPNDAFVVAEVSQPIYGVMLYQSVNCDSGISRLKRMTVFGESRQVLDRFNYGDGAAAQPLAGSSAAAVLQYVCDQSQ